MITFNLAAIHKGYYFPLVKVLYLTSNDYRGNVTIGYYVVVQEYQHAFGT